MTKQAFIRQNLLARLDRLGSWAADSLLWSQRAARISFPFNHGGRDRRLAALHRANAAAYNASAGLIAEDLGLAQLITSPN